MTDSAEACSLHFTPLHGMSNYCLCMYSFTQSDSIGASADVTTVEARETKSHSGISDTANIAIE